MKTKLQELKEYCVIVVHKKIDEEQRRELNDAISDIVGGLDNHTQILMNETKYKKVCTNLDVDDYL